MTHLRQLVNQLRECIELQRRALARGDLNGLAAAVKTFEDLVSSTRGYSRAFATVEHEDLSELLAELQTAHTELVLNTQLRLNEIQEELQQLDHRRRVLDSYAALSRISGTGEDR